jgi:phage head maturation protease
VKPTSGAVEQRNAPESAGLSVDGKGVRGFIPYNIESRDLGGWREIMAAGSLRDADMSELVATVDHAGVPLARFPTTLTVEDRSDGLHWSLELPESRADVREAVERGDLRSASWRMIVDRDRWDGDVRHVEAVRQLRDVAIVTTPAYAEARAEYRAAPEPPPGEPAKPVQKENTMEVEDRQEGAPAGGLRVEDRAAHESEQPLEARVVDAIRAVKTRSSTC